MRRLWLGVAAVAIAAFAPHSASAQDAPDLTLVHALDGVTADVVVNGIVMIDGFVPGSVANITSFAGRTLENVTLVDDATDEVLLGPIDRLPIPDSGSHSIVAHLNAAGEPTISSFENDVSPTADGRSRFTVRHVAEAGAIDVIVGDERPIIAIENGQSQGVERATGEQVMAQVAPTGAAPIASAQTASLDADTNTILYVTGSAADEIEFVVQVVDVRAQQSADTTTTTAGDATTTTAAPADTTTTTVLVASAAVPTAVNTGSPLDGSSNTLVILVALGGLSLAGGATYARRRV